jgi:ABC-type uncharacterized transport system ATPase subunit
MEESKSSNSLYMEPVSTDLMQQIRELKCLSIRDLRKVYRSAAGGNDRIAVDDLDLDMFQNQVTVLLGQNGAGKSFFRIKVFDFY